MTTFYVGSYGKQKGIYACSIDEAGQLELKNKIETMDFASYMIKEDQYLYVAYKNATKKPNGGGIGSFEVVGDTLKELSHCSSHGRSYTHLCLDPNQNYIYAANYHIGTTVAYRLEDHKVVEKTCVVYHRGMGPDLFKRQTQPHPHYVGITPEKKYLYSVDLGSDKIVLYHYEEGKIVENEDLTINVLPGSGPRHMIFSGNGEHAYLVNEIANNIMVFDCGSDGIILRQKISCLPHGFNKASSAAAIRMSEDERYLFVSNRGHNSIAMYKISGDTGKIGLIGFYEVGENPRDFNVIGKYLVVASQNDNRLEVLEIGNDELIRLDQQLSIPEPVCVCK